MTEHQWKAKRRNDGSIEEWLYGDTGFSAYRSDASGSPSWLVKRGDKFLDLPREPSREFAGYAIDEEMKKMKSKVASYKAFIPAPKCDRDNVAPAVAEAVNVLREAYSAALVDGDAKRADRIETVWVGLSDGLTKALEGADAEAV